MFLTAVENRINEWCTAFGEFLDENPGFYKICIVADHFFRSCQMYGLMSISPLSMPITFGVGMLGFSCLYMTTVELRFCSWKFTLPSLFGALALWAARASILNIVAKRAFASLGGAAFAAFGLVSLAFYTLWACYLSHRDVEAYLERKKAQSSCCA
jgi:hypothetical protein